MPFKSDYFMTIPCPFLLKELLDGITKSSKQMEFARGVLQLPTEIMSREEYLL